MAANPLTQAIMQGMDPGVYRPLSDIQTGDALQAQGMDASPTSKWGALGRLAQAAAGTYLSNSATSDLAKTIGAGKRSAQEQLLAAIEAQTARPVPAGAPQTAPLTPPVQQPTPPIAAAPGSANAQVANRFPAEWSPQTAAAPQPPAAASALAAPAAAPDGVAAIDKAMAPRGIRNNNPLNIEDGPFAKSQPGYAGSDGRFAKFETPDQGTAAADALLNVYHDKHGLNTVAGIVGRWAPAGDGNNVSAYANDVAGRLGIDPNAPIPPDKRQALIAAMSGHENGNGAPPPAGQPPVRLAQANINPAVASDAAPAGGLDVHKLLAVLQNPYSDETTKAVASKLLIQQLTPKEDEFASSPQGIYNKRTGELKKGSEVSSDFGGLQGRDLLAAVQKQNPAVASQVTAIIEGRAPYPTGSRLNPVQQQVKELVTQVDPTFESGNSGARIKVRTEFNAGGPNSPAANITAGNTAIQHLGHLSDEAEKLGNFDTPIPGNNQVNALKNALKGSGSAGTHIANFDSIRNKYIEEATKFYRGTGGNEADLQRDIAALNSAQSPSQLREVIKTQAGLMQSKINALQERWKHGMGPLVEDFPIVHPKSQKALDAINQRAAGKAAEDVGGPDEAAAAGTPAAANAAPDRSAVEAELRRRGLLK